MAFCCYYRKDFTKIACLKDDNPFTKTSLALISKLCFVGYKISSLKLSVEVIWQAFQNVLKKDPHYQAFLFSTLIPCSQLYQMSIQSRLFFDIDYWSLYGNPFSLSAQRTFFYPALFLQQGHLRSRMTLCCKKWQKRWKILKF